MAINQIKIYEVFRLYDGIPLSPFIWRQTKKKKKHVTRVKPTLSSFYTLRLYLQVVLLSQQYVFRFVFCCSLWAASLPFYY